ncbi:MAG TPA: PGPGW domain-containing protein [Terriglobales bacterium]|nr:PGPGW domain-containing protein [Terriglobales bacterium]
MKTRFKQVALLIVGWAFILIGIVGLFLPVLQGILFIVIGLVILSTEYAWANRLLTKLRTRFPKIGKYADEGTARAKEYLARWF